MPFGASTFVQVTELRRKIKILEVERTAWYQLIEPTIKQKQQSTQSQRTENKKLRKLMPKDDSHSSTLGLSKPSTQTEFRPQPAPGSECDQQLISGTFQKDWEKKAYRNKSAKEINKKLEESVLSNRKCLNALKHTTETYRCRLKNLKMEYKRLKSEWSCSSMSADAYALKNDEDAMNRRALENKLEKVQFKCREAENIMTNYLKLKTHLQNESLTYQNQLDSLEEEILKHREELHSLEAKKLSSKAFKTQLEQHQEEELLYKKCKEMEHIIAGYKIKIKEYKAQYEEANRRAQRAALQPDKLSTKAHHRTTKTEDEEKKIPTFEDAFKPIKDAIGITDIQEIVERFNSQRETNQKLEKMKEENEEVLLKLKKKKELLSQQFEEMQYSREAKLSSDQQALQEGEQQLRVQQQRCDAAKERMDWLLKTLSSAQNRIEHVADELQHISLSEDTVPEVHPDSDNFVLELMTQCEKKLEALHKEVQGKELDIEELYAKIGEKLPEVDTRVKLSEAQAEVLFRVEKEIDEDEDVITREALKRQSQLIVDSKRKAWNKN